MTLSNIGEKSNTRRQQKETHIFIVNIHEIAQLSQVEDWIFPYHNLCYKFTSIPSNNLIILTEFTSHAQSSATTFPKVFGNKVLPLICLFAILAYWTLGLALPTPDNVPDVSNCVHVRRLSD